MLLQLAQVFCYAENNKSQVHLMLRCIRLPAREPEYVYRVYSSCLSSIMIGTDKDLESTVTQDVW